MKELIAISLPIYCIHLHNSIQLFYNYNSDVVFLVHFLVKNIAHQAHYISHMLQDLLAIVPCLQE